MLGLLDHPGDLVAYLLCAAEHMLVAAVFPSWAFYKETFWFRLQAHQDTCEELEAPMAI